MMVIDNKYEIGDIVFLKHDGEQRRWQVICIMVYKNGEFMYKVVSGTFYSDHYEYEFTSEKDVTITA